MFPIIVFFNVAEIFLTSSHLRFDTILSHRCDDNTNQA